MKLKIILLCLFVPMLGLAQTSWKGTTSTDWSVAANWTAGVPTASVDAIIGDANFTGTFQPKPTAAANVCKSLTIGAGTKASTLTVTKAVTVSGNVTIGANGTITHSGVTTIALTGNWSNSGTYVVTGTKTTTVTFSGSTQSATGTTAFRYLTVNSGSTLTLNAAISAVKIVTINGTLNPNESPTFTITGAGTLTVNAGGKILVKASTFAGNYALSGTITLNAASTVEYAAASASQTVSSALTYGTLLISGTGTRTLAGNLPALNSTATTSGNINISSGTLDLSSFTAARGTSVAGGTFTVASGATLKIGGTATFPANYATHSLGGASTVEYYGTNQTVSAESYGHLTLSSSGAATKTMPITALSLAGNLTSLTNAGGASVSFTAGATLTVNGSVSLGVATTFGGSNFSHTVGANWTNNGTFTGSTSNLTMSGTAASLTGAGTNNFNNLTFTGANITAATNTDLTVAGNFVTSGSGTFTHTPGGTGKVTLTGASKTISGTGINFNHLTESGSISTAASFGIGGNLVMSGSLSASAGTITMSGAGSTISGAGTLALNALSVSGSISTTNNFSLASDLSVPGSLSATAGTATFNGTSSLSGAANLFNVTVNGMKLALGSASVLGVAGTFALTAGTFDVTTSVPNTVTYNAAGAQTALATTYDNLTFSGSGTKTNVAALTINRDLTVSSGVIFSAGPFTNTLSRNWVNNGTFTAGSSTLALSGSLDATVSGATTFNALTLNKSSSANVVTLNTNITVATLNMTLGVMDTGAKAVTITATRTGGGIIFGTITRTHTFSTGVAYAFESTNNTVTFVSASGVSSITMTVIPGAVSDFPFGSSVNREYNASVTASGAYNATLRLHYQDSELNGNTESSMALWRNASGWSSSGKTANDTANNWVEQSARTNLAGRWTLSDTANVVKWNGSLSTAWETAANWTAVQGVPSLPPSSNDVVELGVGTFTFQPTISSSAIANSISFGSTQAIALTIGAGGSLTTLGNVDGTWSQNATHTINVSNQTLSVGGSLRLGDGTNGHAMNLNIGTGSVALNGSLTESGGANITFSGAGTLGIGGDFNYVSGTFTPGSGTVTYNGSGAQIVAGGISYNHLTFAKSGGAASLSTSATVNGNLVITNATTFALSAPLTVGSNVVIASGTTLQVSGATTTLSMGGNWSRVGTFTAGTGTVIFTGTSAQSIDASTFNQLTINKSSGTATLAGNLIVGSDFSLSAGTLDLVGLALARSVVGGTFTMGAGTTLKIGGGFPTNFATRTFSASSTVEYNGAGAQNVSGETYGNLILSNGGAAAKTLAATTIVAGDLIINSNSTFSASSFTLTAQGNWTNSGTFTASTGAVTLSGAGKNLSGATTFNALTVSGSYTGVSNLTVNGAMTVSGTYAAGGTTATFAGDFNNTGAFTSSGTVTFTGTGAQTIALNSGFNSSGTVNYNGSIAPTFASVTAAALQDVNVNNTAGITPLAGWTINGNFAVAAGATFGGGNLNHLFKGNFTNSGSVTSSGTFQFLPTNGVTLTLRGTVFSSSGTVIFGGTGQITIAGGAPSFASVSIENTHAAGVTPSVNWTLSGDLSINAGAIFNGGSGLTHTISGSISDNGAFNGGTSVVVLNGTTEIGGVGATTFNHLTVSGNVTNLADIAVSGNFTNNGAFDATGFNVTFNGGSPSLITGTTTPTPIDSLVIAKTSATVTLGVNVGSLSALTISSGTLDSSTFTLSQNVGALTIGAGGTLKIGGANPLPTFTTYSFDPASTVEFSGTGAQVIAAQNYGGLSSSSSGTRTLANSGTVGIAGTFTPGANTFTNTGSTLDFNGAGAQTIPTFNYNHLTSSSSGARTLAASGTIGIAGVFTTGGNSYTVTNSTVSFNGAAQTIPAFTYHNLTTAGSGAKTLGGAITVGGALNLSAGNLADGGFTATVNGDVASTVTHTGAGKILLSGGTTNHVISGGGAWQNIELNDANGARLNATNLTVNGTLSLTAGKVATSTNKVIIASSGAVSRTAGHVAGLLQKTVATGSPVVVFEIGDPTNFAPVSLSFSNVTVSPTVSAQTVATDHPDIGRASMSPTKSVNRYWSVTNSGGTFSSYRPTLEFVAADIDAAANPTNFIVGKLTGTNWTSPSILARSATNIQTASLTNFGDFQVGEFVNTAPVAGADTITRGNGTSSVKVLVTDLLANDTDANGDTLSITSVTNTSVQGAAIELFGSYVFYTPSSAINVNDSYTYTVSDGQGGTATGTVSVNISTAAQSRQLTSVAAGVGSFYGVLNTAYTVQYVDDISSTNWLALTNITTSANGLGAFVDPGPLPPQRFYRIVYP